MLTENQQLWVDALRSGKYEQGQSHLCKDGKYCCLGVAADLFKTPKTKITADFITYFDDHRDTAPPYVIDALNLRDRIGGTMLEETWPSLAHLNDDGKTFSEIADIFEQNISMYTYEEEI